jgi:hypothetical protein
MTKRHKMITLAVIARFWEADRFGVASVCEHAPMLNYSEVRDYLEELEQGKILQASSPTMQGRPLWTIRRPYNLSDLLVSLIEGR